METVLFYLATFGVRMQGDDVLHAWPGHYWRDAALVLVLVAGAQGGGWWLMRRPGRELARFLNANCSHVPRRCVWSLWFLLVRLKASVIVIVGVVRGAAVVISCRLRSLLPLRLSGRCTGPCGSERRRQRYRSEE